MHPDLSPHLHTDECNEIADKLRKCHEEHKVGKYFGKCNAIDASLVRCHKKEREMKRKSNPKVNQPKTDSPSSKAEPTPVTIL